MFFDFRFFRLGGGGVIELLVGMGICLLFCLESIVLEFLFLFWFEGSRVEKISVDSRYRGF